MKEGLAMNINKEVKGQILTGERALFGSHGIRVTDSIFEDGESPLKESSDIELYNSMFKWKYPLWYCENVDVKECVWFEMARAGVWYTNNITIINSMIEAPKNFRRCDGLTLRNVSIPDAAETLWNCNNVVMENVTAKGDYFAMNSSNINIDGLSLYGNYSFDGAKNVVIKNSKLLSKDAFWNSKNITVYDSYICGEYLGWNASDLTLVNCTVESLQGMCYIENLVMKKCRLMNTTLAFEYSTVEADIDSHIDSIINPSGGKIKVDSIGELIMEKDKVDVKKTVITCRK